MSDPTPGDVKNTRGGFRTDVITVKPGDSCYEPQCAQPTTVKVAGVLLCAPHGVVWMGSQLDHSIHAYKNSEGRKS